MSYKSDSSDTFRNQTIKQFYDAWTSAQRRKALEAASDIDIVRQLIKRLKLTKVEAEESVDKDNYFDGANSSFKPNAISVPRKSQRLIIIGKGHGYKNFVTEFYFDEGGKLLGHGGVWE